MLDSILGAAPGTSGSAAASFKPDYNAVRAEGMERLVCWMDSIRKHVHRHAGAALPACIGSATGCDLMVCCRCACLTTQRRCARRLRTCWRPTRVRSGFACCWLGWAGPARVLCCWNMTGCIHLNRLHPLVGLSSLRSCRLTRAALHSPLTPRLRRRQLRPRAGPPGLAHQRHVRQEHQHRRLQRRHHAVRPAAADLAPPTCWAACHGA